MRDAFLRWCIHEKRDSNNDSLWIAFQAGWRFREQQIKRSDSGSSAANSPGIMDILSKGTLENT